MNGTFTFAAVPEPRLVPFPKLLQARPAYLPLRGCTVHVADASLLPLARLLADEVLAATDGAINLTVGMATGGPGDRISSTGDCVEEFSLLCLALGTSCVSSVYMSSSTDCGARSTRD